MVQSFLCENFKRQCCKAFSSLSNKRAQTVGGGRPPLSEMAKVTHPFKNGDFQWLLHVANKVQ